MQTMRLVRPTKTSIPNVFLSLLVACASATKQPPHPASHDLVGRYVLDETENDLLEVSLSGTAFEAISAVSKTRRNSSALPPIRNFRIVIHGSATGRYLHVSLLPLLAAGETLGSRGGLHGTSLGHEACYVFDAKTREIVQSSYECGIGWAPEAPNPVCCKHQLDIKRPSGDAMPQTVEEWRRLPAGLTARDIARVEKHRGPVVCDCTNEDRMPEGQRARGPSSGPD